MLSRAYPNVKGVGNLFNYGADFPPSNRNLRRLRAALARVRAATGNGVIACVGDSNTRGTGSDGNTSSGTAGYNGWPVKLAALLTAAGVKAQSETFFGAGGYEGAFATYDNRIALSSSGAGVSSIASVGGKLFQLTASGGTLTFTTKTACTQCDLYYYAAYGNGSFSYAVDGGAATTVSTSVSTATMVKLSIALGTPAATHTVTLTWVSGTSYIHGMDCFDATTPVLRIWNWGWHGSTTASWTTLQNDASKAWSVASAIPNFYKPDVIIGPALETNDWNTTNNLSVATMAANKQTLLTSWLVASDVVMLTCGPTAASTCPTLANQKPYVDADYALAQANAVPLLDEWAWMGDEPFMNGLGLYNGDLLHKTAAGHAVTARMVANALLAVA